MKTKANILIEDGQDIKVASVDTPIITSNGKNILVFDDVSDELNIGADYFNATNIVSSQINLISDDYGTVYLDVEGFSIDATNGVKIYTGGLTLAHYTTAERPTGSEGAVIYDITLKKCILYNGTAWVNLDGTALA